MTVSTDAVDPAVYGALAGVAAITTALQSVTSLLPLRQAIDIRNRKRGSAPGQAPYNDARTDARWGVLFSLLLNIFAGLINGAVLAAWWKVGVADVAEEQWEFWLPWVAVAAAAAGLFITAISSIIWLAKLGWGK
jgi:hypothetical protein